jgi:proline dehydrogenase
MLRSMLLAGSRNRWLREHAMRYPFVRRSVSRFMPGEKVEDALEAARVLQRNGMSMVFTHLGENVVSPGEAEAVTAHYLDVLGRVQQSHINAQISVKLTQLGLDVDPGACLRHLMALVERACSLGNFVWIDMESSEYVDVTLDLYRRARATLPAVGVCLQAYLRRTAADLEGLLPLGPAVRIVKGAYSAPASVAFPDKEDVDRNFFELASRLLGAEARNAGAMVAIGTHDEHLIARIRRVAESAVVPGVRVRSPDCGALTTSATDLPAACEYHMLYGIQRTLQDRLVLDHQPVRILVSYGEYWFPWFMRRLAERPANVWFVARNVFGAT